MKRFYGLTLLMGAAILLLSGCIRIGGGVGGVQGTGAMVPHEISAEGFTGLSISGGFDLTFTQAPYFSVTMNIQENLINYLETPVRGDVLHLGFSRNISTTGGNTPRINIYAPYLDSLDVRGAVNANMVLYVERLDIEVAGAANLNLSGSAETLNISAEGAANIDAFDMTARDVTVSLEGAGNVDVHATDTLNASLTGVGRVRYDGDPAVTRSVTGLGTVSRRN